MGRLGLKYLAAVVQALEQSHVQGKLSCYQSRYRCELYFRQGKLFYAFTSDAEQGDSLLYELLNWPMAESWLEWQAGSNSRPPNVDAQEESAWLEALTHLQRRNYFLSTEDALVREAVEEFLAIKTPEPEKGASVLTAGSVSDTLPLKTLLPLGIISASLSAPLAAGDFSTYLANLSGMKFSGYLRFQPDRAKQADFGQALLIVEQGELVYASLNLPAKAETISGLPVLDRLAQTSLNALAIEVAPDLLEAWRGLLSGEKPYSGVPATRTNYQNLLKSFLMRQRSGAIRIYQEGLELFGLLHRGQLLGIFKPESKSGSRVFYLQEQEELPEELLEQGDTWLDVFLTVPATPLQFKPTPQISSEEIELLERSFQAMIRLSVELATPDRVTQHLNGVIREGSSEYPLLNNVVVATEQDSSLPRLDLKRAERKLAAAPKKEVLDTFDYLFEQFLQDYCRPIGPEIFHPMVARTLTTADQEQLIQMGLHLDFLTEEIAGSMPEQNYRAEPADALINPYDF